MTDPERTLLDGLSMPQYCGDFSEVLHAFEIRIEKLDLSRIVNYALRLDVTTAKRLGWVLEKRARRDPLRGLYGKEPHPGGQEAFTIRAQLPWQKEPLTRVM